MPEVRPTRERIYEYVRDYISHHGFPPSMREIAAGVGLKSPSSVYFHLQSLERDGMIMMESSCGEDGVSRCRAIRLLERGESRLPCAPSLVPVLRDPTLPTEELYEDDNTLAYTDFCRYTGGYQQGDFVICIGMSQVRCTVSSLQKNDYVLIRRKLGEKGPPHPVLVLNGGCAQLVPPNEAAWYRPEDYLGYAICMQRNF